MLSKPEFKIRYTTHIQKITGKDYTEYFNEVANDGYDMYKDDPEDLTPEEHAEEEVEEWSRN